MRNLRKWKYLPSAALKEMEEMAKEIEELKKEVLSLNLRIGNVKLTDDLVSKVTSYTPVFK